MAEGQTSSDFLSDEKDLEEGEIDDLEEGEINDDFQGVSGYHFSPREEKLVVENDLQTRAINSQRKSESFIRNQRNSGRNAKHSRDRDERRTETYSSRDYEKASRNRTGFKQNFASRRRDDSSRADGKYRDREAAQIRGNQEFDLYSNDSDKNYPRDHREISPDRGYKDVTYESEDEDFKSLLEQYKHIQEQLDELGTGGKRRSLINEIIDDSFVDVPLDDIKNSDKPRDNLDAEIRKLELDFSQTNSVNTAPNLTDLVRSSLPAYQPNIPVISQSIPTTYEHGDQNYTNEEPFFGIFEPFQIKASQKKVRTLRELSKIDLASRGLVVDNNEQSKVEYSNSKGKGKSKARRRPSKNVRQRMKRKAALRDQSRAKGASNDDVYDELGVGVTKTRPENNGTIIINKQKLKEWQKLQGVGKDDKMTSHGDDYKQTPMEVESDSTESVGMIVESHPSLPPIDPSQPPPPGEETQTYPTSHIMPLMDVKPYGYFHDYGSPWWGGPDLPTKQSSFTEEPVAVYEAVSTSLRDTEIRENNSIKTSEQESQSGPQTDLEVEDEASELALREQLLKSMVTKRAAKNASKVNEKSATSSVASPSTSRAASPFMEPSTRKDVQDVTRHEPTKAPLTSTKVKIAPPKHDPVVIILGEDSEDSESDDESPVKQNSFFGGLDSFIKEARERSTKSKAEVKKPADEQDGVQPSTPTTPEIVSVLSEEKREEYKKLKLQLALKKQQKELVVSRKENANDGSMVTKKSEMETAEQKQKKKGLSKQQISRKIETGNRQAAIKTTAEQEQQHQKRAVSLPQQNATSSSSNEVKRELKILNEELLGHKRLIMQDQKLLESCENQLESSSKALGEHQSRVSLLKQQLQRAERLMKVQEDLVEKLKIQNEKLKQRKSIREINAREVEERLLRTRALLGSKMSQRTSATTGENSNPRIKPTVSSRGYQNLVVTTTGEKPPYEVRPTILNPGQDAQDKRVIIGQSNRKQMDSEKPPPEFKPTILNPGQETQDKRVIIGQSDRKPLSGKKPPPEVKPTILNPGQDPQDRRIIIGQSNRKPLSEVPERIREMSRIVEESISPKQIKTSASVNNENGSEILSKRSFLVEDKRILEKKRLQILEQKLSQKLRQSNARRQVGKESQSSREMSLQNAEERASSDSELMMKRNDGLREPPVESGKATDMDEVDGGLRTQLFMDNDKLEKVKQLQAKQEAKGPSFTHVSNTALPIQFSSTKCAWLGNEVLSVTQHLDNISGRLSAKPVGGKKEIVKPTQVTRRATGPYRSPLVHFRSYRFSPYFRTKKGFTLDSPSFTHLINPRIPFCPFALQGICSDPECPHQHLDDVIPKDKQILEDFAAYFVTASKKVSGDSDVSDDIRKSITRTIDAFAKQYGDKVSPGELRVLFVNHLRKQKSAGVHNIVLEPRAWRPIACTKKDPGTSAPGDECPVVETEKTFSWKSWRRKIQNEIKTRSGALDECQEIRYFSENYDSVKTLEKATQENPCDESLWIRLAMVHMGSNRTEGDKNNNGRKNVDKALNTLAQALEKNNQSEKLWLKYLDVFRQRGSIDELHEVCEEAVELAGSYDVWWAYLEIASDYERKTNVCLKCIEFLILSNTDKELKSHRLLEMFLYLIQLNLVYDFHKDASTRFQIALSIVKCPRDASEILASLAENTTCEDLCLLWLSYIHLVEFSCLPSGFYDPARTGPARIVRKDGVVFPWKPGSGTRHGFTELFRLFSRALKVCTDVSNSPDKVTPVFLLYKNLIALERASGKDESAIRTCQRLLKASPKKIELRLCMAALEQVSGHEDRVIKVYKEALKTCDGHAQIAYSAAKYFIETKNREECYEALRTCVYSKFVLEVPSPGPTTRSRSHDRPVLLQPDPQLLYKKLLAQTLPLDSVIPAAKPGVRPGNLGSEGTYIWLCYCLFIELFSTAEAADQHSVTQTAYEGAIYSTGDRHEVKILWIEYLYYMARRLKDNFCTSEELHDVFHKCLTTVPVVTPVIFISSKSWSDYGFHNEVLTLYLRCLGDDCSSYVYDKYLEMFPDNCQLAIQAVEHLYVSNEMNKARQVLSSMLLKTPYCLDLWKIAISIELKERNFDQARQLYEHATEAIPLTASLWKDFAMFELAHDAKDAKRIHSVLSKAKDRGITIEDFVKDISSRIA